MKKIAYLIAIFLFIAVAGYAEFGGSQFGDVSTSSGSGLASTAIDTSSELSTILTDETGSGAAVFSTTPTLVTPVLGVATGTSLTTSGNVGIGTASPTAILDVNGVATFRGTSMTMTNTTSPILNITDTSGPSTLGFQCNNTDCQAGTTTAHNLVLEYNNGTQVTIGSGTAAFAGTVTSARTTDLGWTPVNATNQACNTTCTSACVVGLDILGTGGFLACTDASSDSCLCAGGS